MITNRSLIIIIMLTAIPIKAQTYSSTNHHIEYSIELNQIKEENLIPKVHSGATHFTIPVPLLIFALKTFQMLMTLNPLHF
ncbi:MAG: hypothetical protein FJ214_11905 [Ignavibacteria bacterium]|nr:hypothetical protein [Ignavibacteria bacterium]